MNPEKKKKKDKENIESAVYEVTEHYQHFEWESVALPYDTLFVDKFISNNKKYFPQFFYNPETFDQEDLKKSLHLIDLNGDHLNDLIFNGFSGGEADYVQFFLNKRDSFSLIFEDLQNISSITKEKNRITKFSIDDPGCCGALLLFEKSYVIDYQGDIINIKKIRQSAISHNTEKPTRFFVDAVDFVVHDEKVYLRESAQCIDKPYDTYLQRSGNILGQYKAGDKGRAIAEKADSTGNKWWFVIMSDASIPTHSIFYDIEDFPTYIKGWMNSAALQAKIQDEAHQQ